MAHEKHDRSAGAGETGAFLKQGEEVIDYAAKMRELEEKLRAQSAELAKAQAEAKATKTALATLGSNAHLKAHTFEDMAGLLPIGLKVKFFLGDKELTALDGKTKANPMGGATITRSKGADGKQGTGTPKGVKYWFGGKLLLPVKGEEAPAKFQLNVGVYFIDPNKAEAVTEGAE